MATTAVQNTGSSAAGGAAASLATSSSDFAVFMTSRLFWYERDAEIMLTISSTALTLL